MTILEKKSSRRSGGRSARVAQREAPSDERDITRTGHYLGHDQTLSLMESEYRYPDLSDRASPAV